MSQIRAKCYCSANVSAMTFFLLIPWHGVNRRFAEVFKKLYLSVFAKYFFNMRGADFPIDRNVMQSSL